MWAWSPVSATRGAYLWAAGATLPGRQMTAGIDPSTTLAAHSDEAKLLASLADHLDDGVDTLRVAAEAADDELFGLEVGVGADRFVGERCLELSHQRIETRLDGESEPELSHRSRRTLGQELRLQLLRENTLQLHRHAREHEYALAVRLVDHSGRHAALV